MADVHVVPHEGEWALDVGGEKRSLHSTQQQAVAAGRDLARSEQGELVVHGEDGQIRQKQSHGNDPRNVPG